MEKNILSRFEDLIQEVRTRRKFFHYDG